jgi:hypothetical protein
MKIKLSARLLAAVGILGLVALTAPLCCEAQGEPPKQTAGVDNTAMGAYRALAQLTFEAFVSGDNGRAAELARILERTWDAAEEHGGRRSLGIRDKGLFEQLDKSMDNFIKPVLAYATKTPVRDSVETAYKTFLDELRRGD